MRVVPHLRRLRAGAGASRLAVHRALLALSARSRFEPENNWMCSANRALVSRRRGLACRKEYDMTLRFSDGEEFDTRGELRVIRRKDGLYVIGQGHLIPIDTREEGEQIIREMRGGKDED